MKVLPFQIPKPENAALVVQEDQGLFFYDKLHQHREIQISLIVKGEGTFIAGDGMGAFHEGDLFVIGENLPHVFKNDPDSKGVHMVSLFFTPESYGRDFFQKPEFNELNAFFRNSELGFELKSNKKEAGKMILEMRQLPPLKRFTQLLELLFRLSKSKKRALSTLLQAKKYGEEEGKRIRDVMEHTLTNFDRNIPLNEISEIANMTPNAFCRYFKQRTNKTYLNFVQELRIGNACKLLARDKDLSIIEIAHRSGFGNLSNFNRRFKAHKGITPSAFRDLT